MFKKVLLGIILVLILLLVLGLIFYKKEEPTVWRPLMELEEYQDLQLENIQSITITRYTEGGSDSELKEEEAEIKRVYSFLKTIQVGNESKTTCDDNTTVYLLTEEKRETTVEIECDNVVINGVRYEMKK